MTTFNEALAHLFALCPPLSHEEVPLINAAGRVLAKPAIAANDLPPFRAAAMDGYALNSIEADPEAMFRIIGTSSAGHGFQGRVGAGECVRIFTGAPIPEGADRVIKQEEATANGNLLTLARILTQKPFMRPVGADFKAGAQLPAPRRLTPDDISTLASMNIAKVCAARRPIVAIIPTGDELVMPGETPTTDQIIASNAFGLKASIDANGGDARILPIARDTKASVCAALELASDADMIITTGGSAVGDYDVVLESATSLGLEISFAGVDIRPGRQLAAGRLGTSTFISLPGPPFAVKACTHIFILPAIQAMLGLGQKPAKTHTAPLAAPLGQNNAVETISNAEMDATGITPIRKGAGYVLTEHTKVKVLLQRPKNDRAREIGEIVNYIPLV